MGADTAESATIRHATTPSGQTALEHGQAALSANELGRAGEYFAAALAAEPDNPNAHYGMGMVRYRQARHALARVHFDKLCELRPELPEAHFFAAACAMMDEDHERAGRGYGEALRLAPDNARHWHGWATLQAVSGFPGAALEGFRKAQKLWPDYHWARYSEGMTLLGMGRWEEGWPLFEARHAIGVTAKPLTDRPLWDGRDIDGQSILLRTEQGIGDAIMCARFVLPLQSMGADVVLETRPELSRLFHMSFPGARIVELGETLPKTDWYDNIMSLPGRCGVTTDSEPWDGPYLTPSASDAIAWKRRVGGYKRPRVGLCWQGGRVPWPEPSGLAIDRRKSIPVELLAELLDVDVTWISLQVPGDNVPKPLHDYAGHLIDMADTAALLTQCDLVISADTSVVHLAGAMGLPCWLLDRFDHCWRWLDGRKDSPWYPTLRIFRQHALGRWEPMLHVVAKELREWTGAVRRALEWQNTPAE